MKTESADDYGVFLPLEPQLHKPNRCWMPGRVMGASPLLRRMLLGAPPASAEPSNISQAYGEAAKRNFPVFGPLCDEGKRRLALSGGKGIIPAIYERLARA